MKYWFETFKGRDDDFHWSLKTRAFGKDLIIAQGEGYKNKGDMLRTIQSIKDNAPTAAIVERKED